MNADDRTTRGRVHGRGATIEIGTHTILEDLRRVAARMQALEPTGRSLEERAWLSHVADVFQALYPGARQEP